MPQLTEITTYDVVMWSFSWDRLWELFDGDRDHMSLTQAHLQAFMKAQLSQHASPRQIEFVMELPKMPAGKINRQALHDLGV